MSTKHESLFDLLVTTIDGTRDSRALIQYQKDPIGFAVDVLGVDSRTLVWSDYAGAYSGHKWDGTFEPLATICNELVKWNDVGVESGTGTGKTFLAAVLTLWFLASFELSRVISLAPKSGQLKKHMWAEMAKLWPRFQERFPEADLLTLDVRMDPNLKEAWSATGFPVGVGANEEVATKAQGAHAEHMLFIFEEGPGIHEAIYAAVEQTCTAPHNLRLGLGNPNHQLDPLHKFCKEPGVTHVRISALDHPNVVLDDAELIPGAVSVKSITRRETRYGRLSRMYQSRVRGVSPAEASDSLIRTQWLIDAARRWEDREQVKELRDGPPAMGVDVSNSPNGDEAAIVRGVGAVVDEVLAEACEDANILGARVFELAGIYRVDERNIGVDAVGVGAGAVNELKRLGMKVHALFGQGAADIEWEGEEVFRNLRAQMWWQLRLDLQHGRIALPEDEELWADLLAYTYMPKGGKIQMEDKEQIRKLLGRSPNKGDAVAYWNWARQRTGGFSGAGGTIATL